MTDLIGTRLRTIMSATFGIPVAALDDTSGPATVDGWDSMNHLHLIVAIEAEFGVSFDPEEALELASLTMLRDAIVRLGGK